MPGLSVTKPFGLPEAACLPPLLSATNLLPLQGGAAPLCLQQEHGSPKAAAVSQLLCVPDAGACAAAAAAACCVLHHAQRFQLKGGDLQGQVRRQRGHVWRAAAGVGLQPSVHMGTSSSQPQTASQPDWGAAARHTAGGRHRQRTTSGASCQQACCSWHVCSHQHCHSCCGCCSPPKQLQMSPPQPQQVCSAHAIVALPLPEP